METDISNESEMIVKRVSVPIGLEELMEGLTKEVLLKKPNDIYLFAADYFSQLLLLRNKTNIKVKTIRSSQSITKRTPKQPSEKLTENIEKRQPIWQTHVKEPFSVKKDLFPKKITGPEKSRQEAKNLQQSKNFIKKNRLKKTENTDVKNTESKSVDVNFAISNDHTLIRKDKPLSTNRRERSLNRSIQSTPRQKDNLKNKNFINTIKNEKKHRNDDNGEVNKIVAKENASIRNSIKNNELIKNLNLTVVSPQYGRNNSIENVVKENRYMDLKKTENLIQISDQKISTELNKNANESINSDNKIFDKSVNINNYKDGFSQGNKNFALQKNTGKQLNYNNSDNDDHRGEIQTKDKTKNNDKESNEKPTLVCENTVALDKIFIEYANEKNNFLLDDLVGASTIPEENVASGDKKINKDDPKSNFVNGNQILDNKIVSTELAAERKTFLQNSGELTENQKEQQTNADEKFLYETRSQEEEKNMPQNNFCANVEEKNLNNSSIKTLTENEFYEIKDEIKSHIQEDEKDNKTLNGAIDNLKNVKDEIDKNFERKETPSIKDTSQLIDTQNNIIMGNNLNNTYSSDQDEIDIIPEINEKNTHEKKVLKELHDESLHDTKTFEYGSEKFSCPKPNEKNISQTSIEVHKPQQSVEIDNSDTTEDIKIPSKPSDRNRESEINKQENVSENLSDTNIVIESKEAKDEDILKTNSVDRSELCEKQIKDIHQINCNKDNFEEKITEKVIVNNGNFVLNQTAVSPSKEDTFFKDNIELVKHTIEHNNSELDNNKLNELVSGERKDKLFLSNTDSANKIKDNSFDEEIEKMNKKICQSKSGELEENINSADANKTKKCIEDGLEEETITKEVEVLPNLELDENVTLKNEVLYLKNDTTKNDDNDLINNTDNFEGSKDNVNEHKLNIEKDQTLVVSNIIQDKSHMLENNQENLDTKTLQNAEINLSSKEDFFTNDKNGLINKSQNVEKLLDVSNITENKLHKLESNLDNSKTEALQNTDKNIYSETYKIKSDNNDLLKDTENVEKGIVSETGLIKSDNNVLTNDTENKEHFKNSTNDHKSDIEKDKIFNNISNIVKDIPPRLENNHENLDIKGGNNEDITKEHKDDTEMDPKLDNVSNITQIKLHKLENDLENLEDVSIQSTEGNKNTLEESVKNFKEENHVIDSEHEKKYIKNDFYESINNMNTNENKKEIMDNGFRNTEIVENDVAENGNNKKKSDKPDDLQIKECSNAYDITSDKSKDLINFENNDDKILIKKIEQTSLEKPLNNIEIENISINKKCGNENSKFIRDTESSLKTEGKSIQNNVKEENGTTGKGENNVLETVYTNSKVGVVNNQKENELEQENKHKKSCNEYNEQSIMESQEHKKSISENISIMTEFAIPKVNETNQNESLTKNIKSSEKEIIETKDKEKQENLEVPSSIKIDNRDNSSNMHSNNLIHDISLLGKRENESTKDTTDAIKTEKYIKDGLEEEIITKKVEDLPNFEIDENVTVKNDKETKLSKNSTEKENCLQYSNKNFVDNFTKDEFKLKQNIDNFSEQTKLNNSMENGDNFSKDIFVANLSNINDAITKEDDINVDDHNLQHNARDAINENVNSITVINKNNQLNKKDAINKPLENIVTFDETIKNNINEFLDYERKTVFKKFINGSKDELFQDKEDIKIEQNNYHDIEIFERNAEKQNRNGLKNEPNKMNKNMKVITSNDNINLPSDTNLRNKKINGKIRRVKTVDIIRDIDYYNKKLKRKIRSANYNTKGDNDIESLHIKKIVYSNKSDVNSKKFNNLFNDVDMSKYSNNTEEAISTQVNINQHINSISKDKKLSETKLENPSQVEKKSEKNESVKNDILNEIRESNLNESVEQELPDGNIAPPKNKDSQDEEDVKNILYETDYINNLKTNYGKNVSEIFVAAAIEIQKNWRGFKVRKHNKVLINKTNTRAAIIIQKYWRNFKNKNNFKECSKLPNLETLEVINKGSQIKETDKQLDKHSEEIFTNAALTIQKLWRGFRTRKILNESKTLKLDNAENAKCSDDKYNEHIHTSIKEPVPKFHLNNINLSDDEKFVKAATKIQTMWRRFKMKKDLRENHLVEEKLNRVKPDTEFINKLNKIVSKEEKSALIIQTLWRGYYARKTISNIQKKQEDNFSTNNEVKQNISEDDLILKAARKIQAGVRGYLQRKLNKTNDHKLNTIAEVDEKHIKNLKLAKEKVGENNFQVANHTNFENEITKRITKVKLNDEKNINIDNEVTRNDNVKIVDNASVPNNSTNEFLGTANKESIVLINSEFLEATGKNLPDPSKTETIQNIDDSQSLDKNDSDNKVLSKITISNISDKNDTHVENNVKIENLETTKENKLNQLSEKENSESSLSKKLTNGKTELSDSISTVDERTSKTEINNELEEKCSYNSLESSDSVETVINKKITDEDEINSLFDKNINEINNMSEENTSLDATDIKNQTEQENFISDFQKNGVNISGKSEKYIDETVTDNESNYNEKNSSSQLDNTLKNTDAVQIYDPEQQISKIQPQYNENLNTFDTESIPHSVKLSNKIEDIKHSEIKDKTHENNGNNIKNENKSTNLQEVDNLENMEIKSKDNKPDNEFYLIPNGVDHQEKYNDNTQIDDHAENANIGENYKRKTKENINQENLNYCNENNLEKMPNSSLNQSDENTSKTRLLHTGELHDTVVVSIPLLSEKNIKKPTVNESSQDTNQFPIFTNSRLLHTGELHDTIVVHVPFQKDVQIFSTNQPIYIDNTTFCKEDEVKNPDSSSSNVEKLIENSKSDKTNLDTSIGLLHTGELHDSLIIPLSAAMQQSIRKEKDQHSSIDLTNVNAASQVALNTKTEEIIQDSGVDPLSVIQETTSTQTSNENYAGVYNSPKQEANELQTTKMKHIGVMKQNQAPAGAEVLTSSCSDFPVLNAVINENNSAQSLDRGALPNKLLCSNFSLPSNLHSMESENRKNATNNKNTESEAAIKIQAGFRGYQVRKQLKLKNGFSDINNQRRQARRKSSGKVTETGRLTQNKPKETNDIEEKSAVKIQAGIRGFLVRRRQKKQTNQET